VTGALTDHAAITSDNCYYRKCWCPENKDVNGVPSTFASSREGYPGGKGCLRLANQAEKLAHGNSRKRLLWTMLIPGTRVGAPDGMLDSRVPGCRLSTRDPSKRRETQKNPQFTSTYFSYDAGEDTVLGQRAMREPTQEMLDAWIRAPGAKEGWQAMIDCALRETGNEPVAKG
jgi:hypothetical protein